MAAKTQAAPVAQDPAPTHLRFGLFTEDVELARAWSDGIIAYGARHDTTAQANAVRKLIFYVEKAQADYAALHEQDDK